MTSLSVSAALVLWAQFVSTMVVPVPGDVPELKSSVPMRLSGDHRSPQIGQTIGVRWSI